MKKDGEIKKYKLRQKSGVRNNIILKIIANKFDTDSEVFDESFLMKQHYKGREKTNSCFSIFLTPSPYLMFQISLQMILNISAPMGSLLQ